MLVTSIPYLAGYVSQGSSWVYTGAIIGTEDINTYMADMVSGSAGAWLFTTPYTPYPQRPSPVFLPYLLLGKLAASPGNHDQIILLFQVFRILAGILAIFATYDFLALFIGDVRWRRFGTVLATLGGGLGWLILLTGHDQWLRSLPVEFYSPEAFGFLMIFTIPHLALARAFLLWGLRSFLLAADKAGVTLLKTALITGVCWLLASLAQPLTGMIAGAVPAAYLVVTGVWQVIRHGLGKTTEWTLWRNYLAVALLAGLVAGPLVLYNAITFQIDPILKSWSDQSAIPAANPLLYVLAYGLILPFGIFGAIQLYRADRWRAMFLAQWIVVFTLAIYIPFSLQRRLIEGVWVALTALACLAIAGLTRDGGHKRLARWLPAAILIPSLMAAIILFMGGLLSVLHPTQPLFAPAGEVRAFNYLTAHAARNAVVLSDTSTGNRLPAWAPLRVVIGIATLSANYGDLKTQVDAFFQPATTDSSRQALLKQLDVSYVFWGPAEQSLGDWDPHQADYLKPVYSQNNYSIFQVAIR